MLDLGGILRATLVTRGDIWGRLGPCGAVWGPPTHVFLQVQRRVVHQRLHHPHEVDEQRQVVLHHVDTNLGTRGDTEGTAGDSWGRSGGQLGTFGDTLGMLGTFGDTSGTFWGCWGHFGDNQGHTGDI